MRLFHHPPQQKSQLWGRNLSISGSTLNWLISNPEFPSSARHDLAPLHLLAAATMTGVDLL